MDFSSLQFVPGSPISREDCCVRSDASMVEVFQKTADGQHSFLFVEDEVGRPIGIIGAEDILRRITDPSPFAFARWMDMPVESALSGRIEVPRSLPETSDDGQYTRVTRDGRLLGVITDNDVLVSWQSIQKMIKASQGDGVTGLPNRAAFDHHLDAEFNRATRHGHSIAVILVDLDYFKEINDQFGHSAGDTALNAVASKLRQSLRSYDMVARFGGDEFGVICSGCRPGEIDIVVRRIREVVMQMQDDADAPRPIPSISVGASVAHDLNTFTSPTLLVNAADECLYAAKERGRNCGFKSEHIPGRITKPVFVEDRFSHIPINNGVQVSL